MAGASERLRAAAWWVLLTGVALTTVATSNLSALGWDRALLFSPHAVPKLITLAVACVVSCALWVASLRGASAVRVHPALWAVGALCAWAVVSAAASVQPLRAFFGSFDRMDGLLTLALCAVVFVLAVQVVRPRLVRPGAAVVVAVGVIAAVYGLIQVAGVDPFSWPVERWALPIGFQGNRDFLGGLLVMPLTLAPFMALTAVGNGTRVAWWVATGVLGACLVVTLVRGAWIAALFGLLLAAVVLWRGGVKPRLADWLSLTAVALAVLGIALLGGPAWGMEFGVLERIASVTQLGSGSIATRFNSWEVAARTVVWRPLTGVGPDNFAVAWTRFATTRDLLVDPGGAVADNAHSYPLNLAATLGVPGLLAAVAAVWLALRGRAAPELDVDDGAARIVRRGLVVAAIAYGVFLLSGFNTIETMALWWLVLGVIAGTGAAARVVESRRVVYAVAGLMAAVALLGFGVAAVWTYADRLVARHGFEQGRDSAIYGLDRAARVAPWVDQYLLARADLFAQAAQEQLTLARQQPDPALVQGARQAMLAADEAYAQTALRAPAEYVVHLKWSRALNRAGTLLGPEVVGRAYQVATRAVAIHPTSVEVRVHKAEAALQLGRPKEAAAVLEEAWKWSPGQAGPAVLYVKALRTFDEPAARRAAAQAILRYPDSEPLRGAMETTGSVPP